MGFRAMFADLFKMFMSPKSQWVTLGGQTTSSQVVVNQQTAFNYSAVMAATRLLCGTGAMLPVGIYEGLDDEERRRKDRKHPAYRLLNKRPNREQTAFNFRSIMFQWQVNGGNAFAEIQREGNDPDGELVALWPIDPCRVTVKRWDDPSPDGNYDIYYEVRGEKPGDDTVEVPPWRMFHVPSIITVDGVVGRGVIDHAAETIGSGIGQEKRAASEVGGNAMPRVVIEHAAVWPKDANDAFRKEWKEIHSGPNGGGVALLGGGATAKALSLSAEATQLLESRSFNVEEIARWYGVPPFLLQHLVNATLNNVEELGISFVQYSLIPWLEIWEQAIWHKLFTEDEKEDYFAEHNVDALQRGNFEARMRAYQIIISSGLGSRNECRKKENWDPVPGGDTILVQGAMVPLDDEGKPESEFTGNAQGQAAAASNGEGDDNHTERTIAALESHLIRIIEGDLSRFLTKETKAIADFAKKSDGFLTRVDDFYARHRTYIRDELTETFGALSVCGKNVNADTFVSAWVDEAKSMILEASGAKAADLYAAVWLTIESKTWVERPLRAIERVKNASTNL